jgi:hypothetical protein
VINPDVGYINVHDVSGKDKDAFFAEGVEVARSSEDYGYSPDDAVIAVWRNALWTVEASGCSCGGSGNLDGPFTSIKDAIRNLSDIHKKNILKEIG